MKLQLVEQTHNGTREGGYRPAFYMQERKLPLWFCTFARRSTDRFLLLVTKAGFGGLPNFDKRNNIPISKYQCEFAVELASAFAQIIHIRGAGLKKHDLLLFLKVFFAAQTTQKT